MTKSQTAMHIPPRTDIHGGRLGATIKGIKEVNAMPLYTVMMQAGALSGEAKAKLACELTAFHSEYAGVPKNWVHV